MLSRLFPTTRNKKETLSQNYRRLGLTAKLGKATGGIEQTSASPSSTAASQDPLAVTPTSGLRTAVQAVKVERDADGKILRVLHKANPLNDPLNDLEEDDEDDAPDSNEAQQPRKTNGGAERRIVDILEEQANVPMEKKHKRHQSEREREWCESLIAKHGEDTAAMARDLKLNPMQQTEANIRKKLATYHGKKGGRQ